MAGIEFAAGAIRMLQPAIDIDQPHGGRQQFKCPETAGAFGAKPRQALVKQARTPQMGHQELHQTK